MIERRKGRVEDRGISRVLFKTQSVICYYCDS